MDKDFYVLRGYEKAAERTELYYDRFGETLKGFLSGKDPEGVIETYGKIRPCVCGYARPEGVETECMGDMDFEISCPKCGRRLLRSMYDFDVTEERDYVQACVDDWNAGLTQKDVDDRNEAERERKRLRAEDLNWLPLHPNNMPSNGISGLYCLLLKRNSDGGTDAVKWTIEFQKKETEPSVIRSDAETEAYVLFADRFFDVKGRTSYPKPSDAPDLSRKDEEETFGRYGVNSKGDFVRAYRSLGEAKEGALARCGQYGLDRDSVIEAEERGADAEDL